MNIKVTKAFQHKTKQWSGGTTTQLFIQPKEAVFKERDFNFRLSKAFVSDVESVFTSLSNVQRKLMVLEGTIELTHEQHHSTTLSKFDLDTFLGDWKTTCKGSCSDFNLMLMNGTEGNVEGISRLTGETFTYNLSSTNNYQFLYLNSGKAALPFTTTTNILETGDLLIIENPANESLQIKILEDSDLVSVQITNLNTI